MKERIQYHYDSFTDFKNEVHNFIICAVSRFDPNINYSDKLVYFGLSVCHPNDEFNTNLGEKKAYKDAVNHNPDMKVSNHGIINTESMKGILRREAEWYKEHPDRLIPGYTDMKNRYEYNSYMEELNKDFNKLEQMVRDELLKDPDAFNNVLDYIKWRKNQEIGRGSNSEKS